MLRQNRSRLALDSRFLWTRWRLILGLRALKPSLRRSPTPAPLFGADLWECLNSPPLPKARSRLRMWLPEIRTLLRLSVVEIQFPLCTRLEWRTRSLTFLPAVGLRWNFWKARNCLALKL